MERNGKEWIKINSVSVELSVRRLRKAVTPRHPFGLSALMLGFPAEVYQATGAAKGTCSSKGTLQYFLERVQQQVRKSMWDCISWIGAFMDHCTTSVNCSRTQVCCYVHSHLQLQLMEGQRPCVGRDHLPGELLKLFVIDSFIMN